MNKSIRWGIWGTGAIAHAVASDFRLASGTVLHAVASRTEERAGRFAAQHGATKWYGGLAPLLDDAEVDVVYVATPNHCHVDDCIACMEAGKAVLVEKPFALNLTQAERMVDAAHRRRVFCMEAMWTRFIPAVMEAKRRIDAGAVGPVRLIQGNFAFPAPAESNSRLFDIAMGGGVLLDIGVYLISLVQHLLGVPQSVHGATRLGTTGVDEQSAFQLLYPNGALASLAASLQVRGTNDVVILGERGALHLCDPFYCAHRFILRSYAPPQAVQRQDPSSPAGVRKFMEAVRRAPAMKSLRRRLTAPLAILQRGRVENLPFAGNGYQFELMEVNRCLREQRTESAIMPLHDSLEVMRTMDTLRTQWGLVYPQEKSGQ